MTMTSAEKQFIDAARQHGRATRDGDAAATSDAYKRITNALKELRSCADKGESFLIESLADDDLSVVTWSALYLLPFKEKDAVAALERVAKSGMPRIAFSAEITLKEWRAGRLSVD
jgi:hypothetical protein